jgi:hypothetical protein
MNQMTPVVSRPFGLPLDPEVSMPITGGRFLRVCTYRHQEKGHTTLLNAETRLEQGGCESLAPTTGTRIFWSQQFEKIDELLTSVIVGLHFKKERLKTLFDLLCRTDACAASNIRSDPTRFSGFRNTRKQLERFIAESSLPAANPTATPKTRPQA